MVAFGFPVDLYLKSRATSGGLDLSKWGLIGLYGIGV